MATSQDFRDQTRGLGVEDDCPVCGYSWPGCQGRCVQHTALNDMPGPYHGAYNDDCPECKEEAARGDR